MVGIADLNVTREEIRLTRREFLKLLGVSSYGLVLAACGVTSTPTKTPVPRQTLTNTPIPTKTATPTIRPTETPTPTSTEGVKTDTWATDSNGFIRKDVMANVVNKALIEDKYAFDMHFGSLKLAIIEDEDISRAGPNLLMQKRIQAKAELESEYGEKSINQLLQAFGELKSSLNKNELDFSNCTAIVERDFEGFLHLTNIIVDGKRLYMTKPSGELFKVPYTSFSNVEFYGLDKEISMFPDLKEENRTFSFTSPMSNEWLPPQTGRPDSRAVIVDDPTGVFPGERVFLTKIMTQFQPQNDQERDYNRRHRPYYPGPFRDPFSPPPEYNPPYDFYTGWHLPVVMESTIYIVRLQPEIGLNVHALFSPGGDQETDFQVFALAGDYHVPKPGFPDNYTGDDAATNTILAQKDGYYYMLPVTFKGVQTSNVGRFLDLNASIPLQQWVEFKTISTQQGIWTIVRLHGQNRYRVVSWVEQYNPDMPAVSANFGPYALPYVSDFLAYQKDLIVSAWGNVEYIPPPQPSP